MAIASYMIIVILLFYGGILWLQFFLSRKPNRWLGLILPHLFPVFPPGPSGNCRLLDRAHLSYHNYGKRNLLYNGGCGRPS